MAPKRNRRSAHLANVAGKLLTAKNKSIGPKALKMTKFRRKTKSNKDNLDRDALASPRRKARRRKPKRKLWLDRSLLADLASPARIKLIKLKLKLMPSQNKSERVNVLNLQLAQSVAKTT